MRPIAKKTEPASLTKYRSLQNVTYDDYPDKDSLRVALANEQFELCCYCMGRIDTDPLSMKIEHWQCQSRYPSEQLNYRNLLGACLGGHGKPWQMQHCDTRKADADLKWNPSNPSHQIQNRLYYEVDGSIRSYDSEFDLQVFEVLNLNLPLLKNHRKGALDAVLDWWKHKKAKLQGPVPRAQLERERVRRSQMITPYCQVTLWWIDQRLGGIARK